MSAMARSMADKEDMSKRAPLNVKLRIKGLKMRNCKQTVTSVALVHRAGYNQEMRWQFRSQSVHK